MWVTHPQLQSCQYVLFYKLFLRLAKKASIGICFPSLEDFSLFLGVGVVEQGLSASRSGEMCLVLSTASSCCSISAK
uniref:Uncharacterized protein n=1 Tax=Arundo donax TaxID=35708 RepID=A0A0A9E5L3_ARUDO